MPTYGRWLYLSVNRVTLLAGERTLDERLNDGWEPFAATEVDGDVTVHLRRWDPSRVRPTGSTPEGDR